MVARPVLGTAVLGEPTLRLVGSVIRAAMPVMEAGLSATARLRPVHTAAGVSACRQNVQGRAQGACQDGDVGLAAEMGVVPSPVGIAVVGRAASRQPSEGTKTNR